jgi:hypothetical protein
MLALKRSLFNREQILINVLKASTSVIFMFSLHVILLSKITLRYFTPLTTIPLLLRAYLHICCYADVAITIP